MAKLAGIHKSPNLVLSENDSRNRSQGETRLPQLPRIIVLLSLRRSAIVTSALFVSTLNHFSGFWVEFLHLD